MRRHIKNGYKAWVSKMIDKLLFMMEQYCDADPKCGPTSNEGTIVGTVMSTGLVEKSKHFYFDTLCKQTGQKKMGEMLLQDCEMFNPNLIIQTSFRGPLAQFNPPNEVLNEIRRRGFKVFTWLNDSVRSDEYIKANTIPFSDYTGMGDVMGASTRFGGDSRVIQGYASADPTYFYDKKMARDIDISFVGAVDPAGVKWPQRIRAINFLKANGINIVVAGGERQSRVSWEEFANFFNRSKMTINFSRNPYDGSSQLKARVHEAMSCATMLLEENGTEMKKLFEESKDFVMFDSKEELLRKVRYYLAHDEEREAVARSGHSKIVNLFNPLNLWGYIFEKLGFELPQGLREDKNFQTHREIMECLSKWEVLDEDKDS